MLTYTYKLTAEDVAALRDYAIEFGPKWKDCLAVDWYNARAEGMRGSILHGLRNNLGPSWLRSFAFDAPIVWPNLRKEKTASLRSERVEFFNLGHMNMTDAQRIRFGAIKRELNKRGTW